MDLYLVRHGETKANARRIYQEPNEPLSMRGAAEVAQLTRAIREIQPTHLYTSYFDRARYSAHFFSYATGLEAQWLPFAHELLRPEDLYGAPLFSLDSAKYIMSWFLGTLKPKPGSKVETREQFLARIEEAREFFEGHDPDARIVLVTHSIFINFFVGQMCSDSMPGLMRAGGRLINIYRLENTGLTHVRFSPAEGKKVCAWQLVSFNSSDHLEPLVKEELGYKK